MRQLAFLFLALFLLVAPARAQNNAVIVGGVESASQTFRGQVDSGKASTVWTGMGVVSGDMVDLELTNTGTTPENFRFLPGMVLEDPGKQVQPILLDENLQFTLQPGESVKKRMRGYCLDFSKEPPAAQTKEDYEMAPDLAEYKAAIAVLYGGLRLDGEDKLKPVLRPLIHRTVVTQRAVWATLGGKNPESKDDLRDDIENEIRSNSTIFPEGQLDCLSERLWNDVQKIMAEAQANE